jgi:hypothetical protein
MKRIDSMIKRLLPIAGLGAICLFESGCSEHGETAPVEQPHGAPPSADWFNEVATERGIDFRFESGHLENYYMPEIMAGGAALFDMDSDGDLDAYLVQGGSLTAAPDSRPPNQLYRNDGDGDFENVTQNSGSGDRGYGMGVAAGDYDSDGDPDLYVTNVGANVLLRNEGDGRFRDATANAGAGDEAWSASAAFVDYDDDGDLDLFATIYMNWSAALERPCFSPVGESDYCYPPVYNAQAPDLLYHNNGDGTFAEIGFEAGLHAAYGYGLGAVSGDFNADGLTDIFVANDGSKNQLWVNQGDGTFVDEALLRGCAVDETGMAKAGMGVDAIDVDDNSTLDLIIVNLREETNSFFLNQGQYFVDATASSGLTSGSDLLTRFGVGFIDFDNDARLDLYVANGRIAKSNSVAQDDRFALPNTLFQGTPGGRFEEVRPIGGTAQLLVATSRAAAFGDVDNDGGIDLLVVNRDAPAYLLHNVMTHRGRWIGFRVLNRHGSDALGATVKFEVGEVVKTRHVRSAYSYQAANDPRIHAGLGDVDRVSQVMVRWVDGQVEQFGSFAADQIVDLRRGAGNANAVP